MYRYNIYAAVVHWQGGNCTVSSLTSLPPSSLALAPMVTCISGSCEQARRHVGRRHGLGQGAVMGAAGAQTRGSRVRATRHQYGRCVSHTFNISWLLHFPRHADLCPLFTQSTHTGRAQCAAPVSMHHQYCPHLQDMLPHRQLPSSPDYCHSDFSHVK